MKLIIYPDTDIWNYMLQDYGVGGDITAIPLNQNCYIWQRFVRKIFGDYSVKPYLLFNNSLINSLKSLKSGDVFIVCDYSTPALINAFDSLICPNVSKWFWIWNPVLPHEYKIYERHFNFLRKHGFKLATFDPEDAERFSMHYFNQFFRMPTCQINEEDIAYDFYFVGFAKNREKEILELQKQLSGFRLLFKVVHSKTEMISYEENITNIKKSRCLVEIVQKNQSGMTLRPLEALAFGKKLLTNNESVCLLDFFNSKNVFLYNKDDMSKINDFLSNKIIPCENKIMRKYDVSSWLKKFE